MKKITTFIFAIAALSTISIHAFTVIEGDGSVYQIGQEKKQPQKKYNYSSGQKAYEPYKPKKQKLPSPSTHVQPNGRGGYSWIEPGDSNSDDILERLPKGHSIEPDGHGGFYVN